MADYRDGIDGSRPEPLEALVGAFPGLSAATDLEALRNEWERTEVPQEGWVDAFEVRFTDDGNGKGTQASGRDADLSEEPGDSPGGRAAR